MRFLICLWCLLSFALSEDYLILEEEYAFKNSQIYAKDLFPELSEDFLLVEIPKNSNSYQVKSSLLISKFEKNGILLGAKSPIVQFKKAIKVNLEGIKQYVLGLYLKEYAAYGFEVSNLELEQLTPVSFSGQEIIKIDFTPKLLKRNSGSFNVLVFDGERNRKIFFRYELEATLEALYTSNKISGGTTLNYNNVTFKRINFNKIGSDLMKSSQIGNVAVRSYTPKDVLITKDRLIAKRVVNKGDKLLIRIDEEGVILEFPLEALKNGAIGDVIKAKALQGKKTYEVEIIDKGLGKLL